MTTPYRCPNCKTNKSRFNLIKKVTQTIKMDTQKGSIIEEYTAEELSPFHMTYNGPELKVQCATCGLIEDEKTFIKFGEMK